MYDYSVWICDVLKMINSPLKCAKSSNYIKKVGQIPCPLHSSLFLVLLGDRMEKFISDRVSIETFLTLPREP